MPYSETLFSRVNQCLRSKSGFEHKKMFGGICYLKRGNMVIGIVEDMLMVRVGPKNYEKALKQKHVKEMDFTGRPMKGYVFVQKEGLKNSAQIKKWIELALEFSATLPKKSAPKNENTTPLKKIKNFGPVTSSEFSSMGILTLGDLRALGFEETCRRWVQYYPQRLNANAFLGVICTLEETVWTKASPEQRKMAHSMAKSLRQEFGLR
jgi:TfoX/Sxy family transcriptional regulator of competence genes